MGLISCGPEEVVLFLLGEEIADVADGLSEGVAGSGGGFAECGGSEIELLPNSWTDFRVI